MTARLDAELVRRGLARSRRQAGELIAAGRVHVDGASVVRPATAVDETRVLPFAESVGGRYSLWSSIGFPAALALGWDAFEELLEGAAEMDRHFRLTPLERNAPVLAAFADLYYSQVRGCETRATFAYDERLRLLPSYLQQLEMESNGKRVTADGEVVTWQTAPITWGGVGTDAQHAVFQLLHQGTRLVPVEFIGAIEPGDVQADAHHRQLLLNMFAQGAALMAGKGHDDPARAYPGDRPSSTMSPASGISKPAMTRSSVDLPDPLGPSIDRYSPDRTASDMPSSAGTPP